LSGDCSGLRLLRQLAHPHVVDHALTQRRNPAKGFGELTAVSVVPAIINAVYDVTDKRIRDLRVIVERLL